MHVRTGKRDGQSLMAADEPCPMMSRRIFVTDATTKIQYLIDTGADLYVFPRTYLKQRREKSTYQLYAANGTLISTFGTVTHTLNFGLRCEFTWKFVVADVLRPIIGVDFLSYHQCPKQTTPRQYNKNGNKRSTSRRRSAEH